MDSWNFKANRLRASFVGCGRGEDDERVYVEHTLIFWNNRFKQTSEIAPASKRPHAQQEPTHLNANIATSTCCHADLKLDRVVDTFRETR